MNNRPETLPSTNSQPIPSEPAKNVYAGVYRVLLWGMIASTLLFVVGIVLALLHPKYVPLKSSWIRQHYDWAVLFRGIWTFNPTAIMMLATIILILTPIARVLISIYAFFVDRDRKYVVVTSTVLLVIILTVVLGSLGIQ
jgi:uncharacterized membrane protein